jgi:tRNA A-37 threonylcarbamoyl transferase component Bud32
MMTQWALDMAGDVGDLPLQAVAGDVIARFADGASTPAEVPRLAAFAEALRRGAPISALGHELRALSHHGYLRGTLVVMASHLQRRPDPELALALARELMDALDPDLGLRLCRGVLALPDVERWRHQPGSTWVTANRMLAEALLEQGDPAGGLRHFEAMLAVDVDDARALRGWSAATRALEKRGIVVEHRSRGLALLEGLDELELAQGFGDDRYELQRPLGRGRHAVVYQAFDRHVGREVAIKRLLDLQGRPGSVSPRVLQARFFAEARTLSTVRSPYVVALLDARPKRRFIALELCRGGNLRLAVRKALIGPQDLDRIGRQLDAALQAVHAVGAVHRDVKPANILVRDAASSSTIALADFGLAIADAPHSSMGRAGTLRYLAPELRTGAGKPTPASDRWSAAVVLLELALTPTPLPEGFDRIDSDFDARVFVPDDVPEPWGDRLRARLHPDPQERA